MVTRAIVVSLDSKLLAVERRRLQRRDIDVVEAIDVDRERLLAVRRKPLRERTDAAVLAEKMMDFLLAELVIRQGVLALDELELRRLGKRPDRASFRADR